MSRRPLWGNLPPTRDANQPCPAQPRPTPSQPCPAPPAPGPAGRFWIRSATLLPIFKRQMEFFFCSILITKMFNFPTFVFPGNVLKTGTFRPDHCRARVMLGSKARKGFCVRPPQRRPPAAREVPWEPPGVEARQDTHARGGHEAPITTTPGPQEGAKLGTKGVAALKLGV